MRSKGELFRSCDVLNFWHLTRRDGLIGRRRFSLCSAEEVFSGFFQQTNWYVSGIYPSPLIYPWFSIFDPDVPSIPQVQVLTTFYCGKLDDTETIVPSLQGLMTLVTLPPFTSGDALEVVKAFVPKFCYFTYENLAVISQVILPRQNEGFDGPSQICGILHPRHVSV